MAFEFKATTNKLHAKFGKEIDFGLTIVINCVRNSVSQKLQIRVWL